MGERADIVDRKTELCHASCVYCGARECSVHTMRIGKSIANKNDNWVFDTSSKFSWHKNQSILGSRWNTQKLVQMPQTPQTPHNQHADCRLSRIPYHSVWQYYSIYHYSLHSRVRNGMNCGICTLAGRPALCGVVLVHPAISIELDRAVDVVISKCILLVVLSMGERLRGKSALRNPPSF